MVEGGWYRTGDLGYIDDNGFLIVYDRLKDIIKYNGFVRLPTTEPTQLLTFIFSVSAGRFQVSPLELEEILVQNPLVDEAAVCGVWSEADATELVCAYIVLRDTPEARADRGIVTEALSKLVADRVAHYKQLKGGIVFVDELPKNPTGKVLRRVLRSEAEKQRNATVLAKL